MPQQDRIPPMAFEERASSWALSLVDILESSEHTRTRVGVAAVAAAVTIVVWIVHLIYPEVFTFFLNIDGWAKFAVAFVLAPPFLVALGAGSFVYPQPTEPVNDETGPMSSFFYQERASRRWKLLITAGLIAAVNFVLMFVTAAI